MNMVQHDDKILNMVQYDDRILNTEYPRASPPAAGPTVLSDWLTGILEGQTWSNGLKSKEMWGACSMHMGA